MKHFILILTTKIRLFVLVFIPILICFSCNSNSSNVEKQKKQKQDLNAITNPTNQINNEKLQLFRNNYDLLKQRS